MAAFPATAQDRHAVSPRIRSSGEFVQVLMKVQRATNLIASTLDLEALLDRVVNDIADSVGNVEVAVWLRASDTGEMVLHGVRGCAQYRKGDRLQIGRQGMVGHVAATGKMRYAPDVRQDPYYIVCEPATRSEVSIPLKTSGQVIGVLLIDHHETDAFSDDQLKVLQALAGHIAIAIENARLFRLERSARERMQQESAEARAIQQALFLKPVPLIPGFAFETAWHPAGSVAGDWFDFIDLGHERYGIALADVSGKGTSAALLMSATRAILRSLAHLYSSPVADPRTSQPNTHGRFSNWKVRHHDLRCARCRFSHAYVSQCRTPSSPAHQSSVFVSRIGHWPAAWPGCVLVSTVHSHSDPQHPIAALYRRHHGSHG